MALVSHRRLTNSAAECLWTDIHNAKSTPIRLLHLLFESCHWSYDCQAGLHLSRGMLDTLPDNKIVEECGALPGKFSVGFAWRFYCFRFAPLHRGALSLGGSPAVRGHFLAMLRDQDAHNDVRRDVKISPNLSRSVHRIQNVLECCSVLESRDIAHPSKCNKEAFLAEYNAASTKAKSAYTSTKHELHAVFAEARAPSPRQRLMHGVLVAPR